MSIIHKIFCPQCGQRFIETFFEGRQRLFCQTCQAAMYENPVPATAAVVFNEKNELLLVKRNTEPKAGQWCLPGGYQEIDETPEQGCLRELTEETGLHGKITRWLGNVIGSSPFYKTILLMGYQVQLDGGQLQPGDDCQEARFFALDAMPEIAFRSHRKILENALNEPLLAIPAKKPTAWGAYVITSGNHVEIAEKACAAGARILQYRDKQVDRRTLLATAKKIRAITRHYQTLFIINDFIDIALLVNADGVHLGQEDIPIEDARKLTPPHFLIGLSTHSLAQAKAAEKAGADYIGSGPLFATPTKAHYVPIGVETLAQVLATVHLPVVAIGGLEPHHIPQLRQLGAKNFAMVRAFQKNTAQVVHTINQMS